MIPSEVVIIGAGAIGCSTSYHLARRGVKHITIVETETIGSGSSSKSASMFTAFLSNQTSVQMAKHSYERFRTLEDELDTKIDFVKIGFLAIATEQSKQMLEDQANLLRQNGMQCTLLTPSDIKYMAPELNVEDLSCGVWSPNDGKFDPYMIIQGYAKKARSLGVKILEGVRAIGFRSAKNKITAVITNQGEIPCNLVINAAGPWAKEVAKWVGIDIPMINSARSILVTEPFYKIPPSRTCVEDFSQGWYYRPETGGAILMGMGNHLVDQIDVKLTDTMINEIIDAAIHRVPILEQASLRTGWNGIRPLSPDDLPMVGSLQDFNGFYLNCGWGGEGIMLSPTAGEIFADMLMNSRSEIVDINLLDPNRFAKR